MTNYRAARKSSIYQSQDGVYEVLCIGWDEDQGGESYGSGEWCDFVFATIPEVSESILSWVDSNSYEGNLHVVDNGSVRVKTQDELNAE